MAPYRRRLTRTLIWLRVFALGCVLFAGLGIGALLRLWARWEHPAPGDIIALAVWGLALLVGGGAALFFLLKAGIIIKRLAMLGGSFSPKTPAASAEGGELEEKK
jgi:hypothetical protein